MRSQLIEDIYNTNVPIRELSPQQIEAIRVVRNLQLQQDFYESLVGQMPMLRKEPYFLPRDRD